MSDHKSSEKAELPEMSRLNQLKMLGVELLFKAMALVDGFYSKLAAMAESLYDKLPISGGKKAPLKKLLKKLWTIFMVMFAIFLVFVWLNPLLGFIVILLMAVAIFNWPDLAMRYEEYKEIKKKL